MNTLYFTYAIEVERTASITQAADNLFMSQPTLSKAIKELERNLGFPVFRRTSRGVIPTPKGAEFLTHAKKIVAQIEKMELALQAQDASYQLFSLACPRVSYIAKAVAQFTSALETDPLTEMDILETSSIRVIDAVANRHYVLGIIRYHVEDEDYFLKSLTEKGLQSEPIWRSQYLAIMHEDHPLARQHNLSMEDFAPYMEIVFGDDEVPYIKVSESANSARHGRRMLVNDRAMQMDMLRENPQSYLFDSSIPRDVLERNHFMQRNVTGTGEYKDLLISRVGYRFSKLDRSFINALYLQRNNVAYGE